VKIYTSTVDERRTHHAVKFNAYAKCIEKKYCTENPHIASQKFHTAPQCMQKRPLNMTYAATLNATPTPSDNNVSEDGDIPHPPDVQMTDNNINDPLAVPKTLGQGIMSIESERTIMQSNHQALQKYFQKVLNCVFSHFK
jgi:hypothetical protein